MILNRKRVLLIGFFALAVALLLVATLPEDNEGVPSNRNAEKNCGTTVEGCHNNDTDTSLTIEASPTGKDNQLFIAPIYKDGEKLEDTDYKKQAKAVAVEGSEDYIDSLDNTDNEGELDISSVSPDDGDEFWVGFGYIDKDDTRHVFYMEVGYTYEKANTPPVPKAKISVEDDFPDDDEKTIVIEEGDDDKTLETALGKDGTVTIYFSGSDSTDADAGDTLTFHWDIDGDGEMEDGSTGLDLDETGEYKEHEYGNAGTYELMFMVSDGSSESTKLNFVVEIKDTEKKPELHPVDFLVEDEDGNPETDFEKGDIIEVQMDVENKDDSGFGANTDTAVKVTFYYALDSESYATWYELYDTDTGTAVKNNDKKLVPYSWDTSDFTPDTYKIKVVVDEDDDISEWDEDNNEEIFSDLIYLDPSGTEGNPIVSFKDDITFEYDGAKIMENDEVTIDVLIQNTGDGDATNVQVHLYIGNKKKTPSSSFFDVQVGETKKLSELSQAFLWSPSLKGNYDIKLEIVYYDSDSNIQTVTITEEGVEVEATTTDPGDPTDPGEENVGEDDGGFLPGFELAATAAAVALVALVISRKR